MSKKDKILEQFNNGYNCTQSILTTYSNELGLDENLALKIATGFGGGFGKSGETCGALTGAFMAISLKHGQDSTDDKAEKARTQEYVNSFIKEFKEKHGPSINCRDLLGCDISTVEGAKEAKNRKHLCNKVVETAAELTEKYLNKES